MLLLCNILYLYIDASAMTYGESTLAQVFGLAHDVRSILSKSSTRSSTGSNTVHARTVPVPSFALQPAPAAIVRDGAIESVGPCRNDAAYSLQEVD